MNVIPFSPAHLVELKLQPHQIEASEFLSPAYVGLLSVSGTALTAEHNGTILACCGIAETHLKSGILWAFLAADSGRHFVRLDRCVRRFLDSIPYRRIEATVKENFAPGCRWLDLLGFRYEGPLYRYGPDGADYARYARLA